MWSENIVFLIISNTISNSLLCASLDLFINWLWFHLVNTIAIVNFKVLNNFFFSLERIHNIVFFATHLFFSFFLIHQNLNFASKKAFGLNCLQENDFRGIIRRLCIAPPRRAFQLKNRISLGSDEQRNFLASRHRFTSDWIFITTEND